MKDVGVELVRIGGSEVKISRIAILGGVHKNDIVVMNG